VTVEFLHQLKMRGLLAWVKVAQAFCSELVMAYIRRKQEMDDGGGMLLSFLVMKPLSFFKILNNYSLCEFFVMSL
jgi:hypothetical protein